MAISTRPSLDAPAPRGALLACAEVWGGNRPVDTRVDLPGVRGVLYSRPCAGGRGGDVHYLSVCGSGLLARMCLADVVGHGEAVATISSEMHAQLRRFMNWPDQRRVLRELNRRLERIGLNAMTTAAALTYYPPSRKLSVSYAGHPPGWYFNRAKGVWSRLSLEHAHAAKGELIDGPLAVDPDADYSRRSLRVNIGDRLLVVTDGVLEAPGADGVHFGDVRVEQVLARIGDAGPERIGAALLAALEAHCDASTLAHDDVSFLAVEFVPGPRGPTLWTVLRNRLFPPRNALPDIG